ncbi:MAG: OB-fold nucleic acid binding domain-containing protein [Nanoarchaeota archaeon]|nr:OB-fold nucleic acid binding domain-containing protein [Nanoarchaeota archaeon]
MPNSDFKRNIAYKLRIGDLLVGKSIMDGERFSFLGLGDRKIIRVNIVGNVIDRYNSTGEKKYSFLTIDDGSGQIKLKSFGDDIDVLENLNQGDTVVVIGTLRNFNNELYISPEIVRIQDPKYLLVRKIELEKSAPEVKVPAGQQGAIRDKILEDIKNSEEEGGIFVDKIIMSHRDVSAEIINQEIQKLLEEGIIFEPRPGKVRYLG